MEIIKEFFDFLAKNCSEKGYFEKIDNELVELYCQQLLFIIKASKNTPFMESLKIL